MSVKSEIFLTVQDVLTRPVFQEAIVAAGHEGLQRRIRWVHILEIANFETLLHGEEMILTTGLGFSSGAITPAVFLRKLIDEKASCLCIEVGKYFEAPTDELIELANRYRIPLILFPSAVRFVDITQDIHVLIIQNHNRMIQNLEHVSRQMHRMTLTAQGTSNVLKLLHQNTNAQIFYRPEDGPPVVIPPLAAEAHEELLRDFDRRLAEWSASAPAQTPYAWKQGRKFALVQPIEAFGQTWAYIGMAFDRTPLDYDSLLLDSAAVSIAQELLRVRYMEERKLYTENLWVDDLLNDRLRTVEQIKAAAGSQFKKWEHTRYRVCVIEFENHDPFSLNEGTGEQQSDYYHLSMILRSAFKKFSFHPLITLKNNQIAILAFDQSASKPEKVRIQLALECVNSETNQKLNAIRLISGIGRSCGSLAQAVGSYQEALQALALHPVLHQSTLFYEELGVFQLLLGLQDRSALTNFANAHLGPLIAYDQSKNGDLVLTLKIFLDHNGSKQITAQKLFIVRQSLYYRLDKISELLGYDFMSQDHRLTLHVALRAYQLLNPDIFRIQP